MKIRRTHDFWSETHIQDGGSKRTIVHVDGNDSRAWLSSAAICPELQAYQIQHLGLADMTVPYEVVRTEQEGAFFLACDGGEGQVLVDGRWRKVAAGTACLLPPRILNALRAVDGQRWQFCWVRYKPQQDRQPLLSATSPVLTSFDAAPLRAAIGGLHAACMGEAIPAAIQQWTALVQTYVLHFSRAWQHDERVARLWARVEKDLAADWTAARLAAEASLSFEQLRRLCRRHLGRSPMHHLTHLRMAHASKLLIETDLKIDAVAREIGFANGYTFSATFKKWIGWAPSEFRRNQ